MTTEPGAVLGLASTATATTPSSAATLLGLGAERRLRSIRRTSLGVLGAETSTTSRLLLAALVT